MGQSTSPPSRPEADLAYSNLSEALLGAIPELTSQYDELFAEAGNEDPGAHVVYGDLLAPLLIQQLESNREPRILARAFELLEVMARHPDKRVQEVVAFSVLERLADEPKWIEAADQYVGPQTRKLINEVRKFWGL